MAVDTSMMERGPTTVITKIYIGLFGVDQVFHYISLEGEKRIFQITFTSEI